MCWWSLQRADVRQDIRDVLVGVVRAKGWHAPVAVDDDVSQFAVAVAFDVV